MASHLCRFVIPKHLKDEFPLLKKEDAKAIEDANPRLVVLVLVEVGFVFVLAAEKEMEWELWCTQMYEVYKSLCNDEKEAKFFLKNLYTRSPEVVPVEERDQFVKKMLEDAQSGKFFIGSIATINAWKS